MSTTGTFPYHSLDDLRRAVQGLFPDIALTDDISPLLRPVPVVGGRIIPNALAVNPMEGRDADDRGKPSPLTFRRYRRYAQGGAGLIWFEGTSVSREAANSGNQLLMVDENVSEFEALLAHTRKEAEAAFGPSHSPLCILQLQDTGRHRTGGKPAVVTFNPYRKPTGPATRLLTDDEVEKIEDSFVAASLAAERAGFDGVDIKSCNGYLGADFLAAHTRSGKYGGSFEGRTRFLYNIIDRLGERVAPGFLLTVRLNLYDAVPYPHGWGVDREDPLTPDLTEPIALGMGLGQRGVAIIGTSLGLPEYSAHLLRPSSPSGGEAPPPEHDPLRSVSTVFNVVGRFQKALPDMAVVGSAYSWLRNLFPHAAASNVQTGNVRIVGLGRMSFAYPHFARDLMEHGVLDRRLACTTCGRCTELLKADRHAGCVLRDWDVYGPEFRAMTS